MNINLLVSESSELILLFVFIIEVRSALVEFREPPHTLSCELVDLLLVVGQHGVQVGFAA